MFWVSLRGVQLEVFLSQGRRFLGLCKLLLVILRPLNVAVYVPSSTFQYPFCMA